MEVTRVRTNKLIHIYNAELQCVVMWTIIPLHMPPQGSTRTDTVAQSFPRVLLLLLIGLYGQLQGLKVCESCTEAATMQYR